MPRHLLAWVLASAWVPAGGKEVNLFWNAADIARETATAERAWNATALARRIRSSLKTHRPQYFAGRLDRLEVFRPSLPVVGHRGASIALYWGPDASIAVSLNGRVQCVLELERYFEERHHFPRGEAFREGWLEALGVVRDRCECESFEADAVIVRQCPSRFENGAIVFATGGSEDQLAQGALYEVVSEVFSVERWRTVNHHEAHALLAFHDSPFRSALVVSYDGGGNDGAFNAYLGLGTEVRLVSRLPYNMGRAYEAVGMFLPEVTGCPILCNGTYMDVRVHADGTAELVRADAGAESLRCAEFRREVLDLSFAQKAGTIMGYCGAGALVPGVKESVGEALMAIALDHMEEGKTAQQRGSDVFRGLACRSVGDMRAIAASAQKWFEEVVLGTVWSLLEAVRATVKVEGIVFSGGCALNVLANELACESLTAGCDPAHIQWDDRPRGVYVPAAPNDGGLAVGALWKMAAPPARQPLQYLGFRLFDLDTLDREAARRGAKRLSALGGVEYLAELLAGGPPWMAARDGKNKTLKPIVAVVRGRQEFGPRALGHRSLLAVPDSEEVRDRMNRLKFRQWYRPVAPMIADEALEYVFGHSIESKYMTMAPRVRDDVLKHFPALAHVDGTARHQSVGRLDEPWVHSLLLAVGKHTGLAALINTSFNSKGKPIANTVRASLRMLDTLPDLDYVLIEDWLFQAPLRTPAQQQGP